MSCCSDGFLFLHLALLVPCTLGAAHLATSSLALLFILGRAYLFDQCVNVTIGKAEDRLLITGLHSVCDIYCKRCKNMVGWTYAKAYEASQKYKEGKFIIEKINLHLEESPSYDVVAPAGERSDRWRRRSMSWGNEFAQSPPMSPRGNGEGSDLVYEYRPSILPQSGFNRCQSM